MKEIELKQKNFNSSTGSKTKSCSGQCFIIKLKIYKTNLYRRKKNAISNNLTSIRKKFKRTKRCKAHSHKMKQSQTEISYIESVEYRNKFRECLTEEDKIRYDEKMEINKERPAKDLILRNKQAADSSQFIYSLYRKKLILRKKFKLKNIDTKLYQELNPIKDVRLADYVFPLDSSV